jgi:hypothetical protein
MWDGIYKRIERVATWPSVALLLILFLLCAQGFEWRRKTLGYGIQSLDARFWYSPDEASAFFDAIKANGQRVYAITQLTLDVAFPFIYGLLFAILLIHLYSQKRAKKLVLVPVLTASCDLLENITTAYLALRFKGQPSPVAWAAAIFTSLKWALLILSLILIAVGAVVGIIHYKGNSSK